MEILWSGSVIILAALIVGWGAETAQFYVSRGLVLAVIAWLQISPEFAVEASFAWNQKQDLIMSNVTGSLRLILGLGLPLVYFIAVTFRKPNEEVRRWDPILMPWFNGLEVFILLITTIYFAFIWLKGSLTLGDSFILLLFYFVYIFQLSQIKRAEDKREVQDLPYVGRKISVIPNGWIRGAMIGYLFAFCAILLTVGMRPFLKSLEADAAALGCSRFFFIQWIAPFACLMPTKITAFRWARQIKKAPMALANLISSNAVQWTLLVSLLPVIYSFSHRSPSALLFDAGQEAEILLTVAQSLLGVAILMDLKLGLRDAAALLALWAVQFFIPSSRTVITIIYFAWAVFELILLAGAGKTGFALKAYRKKSV